MYVCVCENDEWTFIIGVRNLICGRAFGGAFPRTLVEWERVPHSIFGYSPER